MKLSVSLPDEDVEFLDLYARTRGYQSRSAVVHRAVRLLRADDLGGAYADAWNDWSDNGDEAAWDRATGDGISIT